MKKTALKEKKRPVKELRDQLRRDQIVSAARACVVRHGFHAASVGQIAAAAQMSVGQIYRYFPSKDAIVRAIVERITARRVAWMLSDDAQFDLSTLFANRRTLRPEDRVDRVLLMEITAEATRNAAVAEIVRDADGRLHRQAVELMRADFPDLSEQQASARVEFIAVVSEGSAFRYITEQHADPAMLAELYRDAFDRLFPNAPVRRTLLKPGSKPAPKPRH